MIIAESHRVRDGSLFNQPSCAYSSLLIAVGIIVFIGTLVATGFLHSEMGNTSFAIAGSGAVFFVVCFAISQCSSCSSTKTSTDSAISAGTQDKGTLSRQTLGSSSNGKIKRFRQDESKIGNRSTDRDAIGDYQSGVYKSARIIGNSTFNRVPCPRVWMSCFANTAIQILAHVVPFRDLFDSSVNQLSKRDSETDEEFKGRQQIQEKGSTLINKILLGKSIETDEFKEFINIIFTVSKDERYSLYFGSDATNFVRDSLNALYTWQKGLAPFPGSFPISRIGTIKSAIERNSWTTSLKTLRLTNDGSSEYIPELEIEGIGTFQLRAVVLSSNFDPGKSVQKFGHATPVLRTEKGELYQVDDLTQKTIQMTDAQLSTIFSSGRGWTAAYYVLVE